MSAEIIARRHFVVTHTEYHELVQEIRQAESAAREEALEEAAKICDTAFCDAWGRESNRLAEAIRALLPKVKE